MAAVKKNNLYFGGYQIDLPDGRSLLKRPKPVYIPLAHKDRTHIIREGDKPWLLAFKFYGDDKRWYAIMDANKIFNPFDLPVGVEIIIPDLDVIDVGQ